MAPAKGVKCSKDWLSKSNLRKLSMNTVANGVKTTISDNRNNGNEDNNIGDIIAQNRTHKNAAETWPQKSATSCENETTAAATTTTRNKVYTSAKGLPGVEITAASLSWMFGTTFPPSFWISFFISSFGLVVFPNITNSMFFSGGPVLWTLGLKFQK